MKKGKGNLRSDFFRITVFLAAVYVFFQSRSLTGGDGGDLVAAAVTRGIAHPPGYPFFTLLGWLVSRLPFGFGPAWRVGLLSSLPAAGAVGLFFLTVSRLTGRRLVAWGAALALGFNYLFWLQAEVQEVFGLHLLFLFAGFYLVLVWYQERKPEAFYWLALVTGLEVAHHHTFALFLPAVLPMFFLREGGGIKTEKKKKVRWGLVLLSFLLGASFCLYLAFGFDQNSPAVWQKVSNGKDFLRLILRMDYGTLAAFYGSSFSVKTGILAVGALFYFLLEELRFWGTGLAVWGLILALKKERLLAIFSLVWFLISGPGFQFWANFPLNGFFALATVERFYLLVYPPVFYWLARGLDGLVTVAESFLEKQTLRNWLRRGAVGVMVLAYPLFLFGGNRVKADWRNFRLMEGLGKDLLDSCPENGVLLVYGDQEVFSTYYLHDVLGYRPDLTVTGINRPVLRLAGEGRFAGFEAVDGKREVFLKNLGVFLKDHDWPVCASREMNWGEEKKAYPWGMVFLYPKEEPAPEAVFEKNAAFWQGAQERRREKDRDGENFFNQSILKFYFDRRLAVSSYFFASGDNEKAKFFLDLGEADILNESEEEQISRLKFLFLLRTRGCEEAEKLFDGNSSLLAAMKGVYEEECLKKEE